MERPDPNPLLPADAMEQSWWKPEMGAPVRVIEVTALEDGTVIEQHEYRVDPDTLQWTSTTEPGRVSKQLAPVSPEEAEAFRARIKEG